ncbi:hypothetical protein [Linepithema humile rhabdo-like virus 1]|uniref:Uncharacterized protein n=1 Tax=Linepithema humile rhabdo-like virus 1 TaxID=2259786 RepID=A0AAD0LE15_9MONO|nr:hypothetical protein QKQ05_gp3 [Linepithema humile rhabdo-like virus 1]AXA52565.1 hypothetical protein [Linepithema humile rhabdo-like virus 1]UXD80056.1 hypothetical protein [Linepithema humile rhabdo-like virus 1]
MPIHVICIKYKIKDALKGWSYTGVFRVGETGSDSNDTEEEIKRKVLLLITSKSIVMTHSLFLVFNMHPLRTLGISPYDKNWSSKSTTTYKINVATHLGLSHYVVAGTTFILEGFEIALYDKENYVELYSDK